MRIKLLLLFCGVGVLFSACSNHIYAPALLRQDIAYQPKPASFDSSKFATYFSGGVNLYSNQNLDDQLVSGQFNLSQGATFKHANLAYGAFGVFGDYGNSQGNSNDANYFTDKFFGAVGGRISGDLFFTSGRTDIRIIGFEATYSHEFGSYADFRKANVNAINFHTDTRTDLVTIGLTSEILFHNISNTNIQHGIRGFLGYTFGNNDLDITDNNNSDNRTFQERFFRNVIPKLSYFIKVKQYFGTVEVGNGAFIRVGASF